MTEIKILLVEDDIDRIKFIKQRIPGLISFKPVECVDGKFDDSLDDDITLTLTHNLSYKIVEENLNILKNSYNVINNCCSIIHYSGRHKGFKLSDLKTDNDNHDKMYMNYQNDQSFIDKINEIIRWVANDKLDPKPSVLCPPFVKYYLHSLAILCLGYEKFKGTKNEVKQAKWWKQVINDKWGNNALAKEIEDAAPRKNKASEEYIGILDFCEIVKNSNELNDDSVENVATLIKELLTKE